MATWSVCVEVIAKDHSFPPRAMNYKDRRLNPAQALTLNTGKRADFAAKSAVVGFSGTSM